MHSTGAVCLSVSLLPVMTGTDRGLRCACRVQQSDEEMMETTSRCRSRARAAPSAGPSRNRRKKKSKGHSKKGKKKGGRRKKRHH